jgi:hypothetical protein
VNFRCERWQTPEGGMMTAPLPARVSERMCKQVSVSLPLTGDSHDDELDDYA